MKKVNFISALSPQKQYEIHYWFWASFFIYVSTCIIGASFLILPVLSYVSLKKEITVGRNKNKQYADILKNKNSLTKDHESITLREIKVNHYSQQVKNMHDSIAMIMQVSGNDIFLESAKFDKKTIELVIICAHSDHVSNFIKKLQITNTYTEIKLVEMRHEENTKKLKCTIKGIKK